MTNLIVRTAANALGVWLGVALVDGLVWDGRWQSMLLIVLVLGLVNALVRPIARLLSLPLVILTLGLFILVVNAFMLQIVVWVTGDALVSDGFGSTFLAALVISIVSWIVTALLGDGDD